MAAFPEVPGYELKKFLGSGGAADVFLAVDRKHSRLVAVKVLARRRFAETVAVRRFIKEAQTISSLHHPNIVRIYETGRTPELRFMAMEFFPESLKRRIQERGRLPGPTRRWPSPTRWRRPCSTPTPAASSTATSSPTTSCSAPTARRCSSISASPASWSRPPSSRARAWPWARRAT